MSRSSSKVKGQGRKSTLRCKTKMLLFFSTVEYECTLRGVVFYGRTSRRVLCARVVGATSVEAFLPGWSVRRVPDGRFHPPITFSFDQQRLTLTFHCTRIKF